jgi:hypothetical protein
MGALACVEGFKMPEGSENQPARQLFGGRLANGKMQLETRMVYNFATEMRRKFRSFFFLSNSGG